MLSSKLEIINKQYNPAWKALKPDAIKAYEETKAQFQHTLKYFCGLLEISPPPRDILELACGTGIAAVELARQGYNVTGIDCSPEAIEVAKILQKHTSTSVQWQQDDMRSFNLDAPVDYILLWDVVFGIFASSEEDSKVLRQISTALKAGGRCLFQFYNKSFAIHHGIEDRYIYNQSENLFVLDQPNHELPIKQIKLYSEEEWRQMLKPVKMKIIKEDASRLPGDPQNGPARVNYLVTEKCI